MSTNFILFYFSQLLHIYYVNFNFIISLYLVKYFHRCYFLSWNKFFYLNLTITTLSINLCTHNASSNSHVVTTKMNPKKKCLKINCSSKIFIGSLVFFYFVRSIDGTSIPLAYEPHSLWTHEPRWKLLHNECKFQIKLFVNLENSFKHDTSIPKILSWKSWFHLIYKCD